MNRMPIVLASASPRRKQLLEWAEIPFELIVRPTDESWPAGLGVGQIPVHIARNKALAVKSAIEEEKMPGDGSILPEDRDIRGEGRVILAADTVVVLDGEIIGKPRDREDAVSILTRLSGNRHEVITGVVILHGKSAEETAFSDVTEVWFHELTSRQIGDYVDKYKPYDKAGAYAIQEWIGVVGIRSIRGDFYNVMGLPVSRVYAALAQITR